MVDIGYEKRRVQNLIIWYEIHIYLPHLLMSWAVKLCCYIWLYDAWLFLPSCLFLYFYWIVYCIKLWNLWKTSSFKTGPFAVSVRFWLPEWWSESVAGSLQLLLVFSFMPLGFICIFHYDILVAQTQVQLFGCGRVYSYVSTSTAR